PALRRQRRVGHAARRLVGRVEPVQCHAGHAQAQLHAPGPVHGVAAGRARRAAAAAPVQAVGQHCAAAPGRAGKLAGPGAAGVVAQDAPGSRAHPHPAPPRQLQRQGAAQPHAPRLPVGHCCALAQDAAGLPAHAVRGLPGRHAVGCHAARAARAAAGPARAERLRRRRVAGFAGGCRHRRVRLRVGRQGRPRVCARRAHCHPEQGQRRLVVRLDPARGRPRLDWPRWHVPAQPRVAGI
ncbi:hypothetical protein IWW55_002637, partial [Coemansia sp. RSA 2706]